MDMWGSKAMQGLPIERGGHVASNELVRFRSLRYSRDEWVGESTGPDPSSFRFQECVIRR